MALSKNYKYSWNDMYELYKRFINETGITDIPYKTTYQNKNLGIWVHNQRTHYNMNLLSDYQVNLLNEVNFQWKGNNNYWDVKWDQMYELLLDYMNNYGNLAVKLNCVYKDTNLGVWVSKQRRLVNEGNLNGVRLFKLQKIGFLNPIKYSKWMNNYELLKLYKQHYGKCDVPSAFIFNGNKLGSWVDMQRLAYHNKKGRRISEDKIALLEEIGFKWNIHASNWDYIFELFKDYINKSGISNCDLKCVYKEVNLGLWVRTQRTTFKNKKLSQDRHIKLKEIGFIF